MALAGMNRARSASEGTSSTRCCEAGNSMRLMVRDYSRGTESGRPFRRSLASARVRGEGVGAVLVGGGRCDFVPADAWPLYAERGLYGLPADRKGTWTVAWSPRQSRH